jgi:homoserine kinase type II
MALYTELRPDEIAEALAAFGLPAPTELRPEPRGTVNTNHHVWAGGERWFFRLNEGKSEVDAAFEVEVHRYLEEAHFPIPRLVLTPDGAGYVLVRGKPAMLFGYAPGEEVRLREAAPDRCRRVGEQLGRLHDLAAGFGARRENPYGPSRVRAWLTGLEERPHDPAIDEALPALEDELTRAPALPSAPQGLVHGDLFVDNVLWVGARISTILDWEMSCTAPFAFDLGVAVNAWCFTDGFQRDRAHALVEGYRSRRKVEPETLAALYPFARYAALRFTVSRLNAFHATPLGEDRLARKDWRRYRDRLLALRAMGDGGFGELCGI